MKAAIAVVIGLGLLTAACTSDKADSPTVSVSAASPTTPTTGSAHVTSPPLATVDWYGYHGDPQRSGFSQQMPAASGKLTATKVALDGQVYASPIVVDGTVIVATEKNNVYGLSLTGQQHWKIALGEPTARSALPCGNIDPLGVTGTPVYDPASRSVFLVASIGSHVRHDLVSLDPATGAIRWRRSVDLPGVDAQAMQERGALTLLAGRVWVPFGGLAGDCGAYKGRLVGVPTAGGEPISYTVPTSREAGIWTPPGPTVFGSSLLVAVGNGESVGGTYDFSDSVLRVEGTELIDSFSPSTWASDNASDLDLGSQGPALVEGRWVFTAGKSGTAYVLNAAKLGGVGGQVAQGKVCRSFGGTAVFGATVYVPCADGLRAVRISDTGKLTVAWHAADSIAGSPVVGGGRVYALDQSAGTLAALDQNTGKVHERVQVGDVSRFATPAISGSTLYVPTLAGLSVVQTR
jgi:outer membrane protein assembly factor BamB